MDLEQKQHWTSIITPVKRFSLCSLQEIQGYGFLIRSLVLRNLKTHYFQTVFGPLWLIIQPLATSFVFIMVFSRIARISTDGSPALLFYFSGIILWNFFSRMVNSLSRTFNANVHLYNRLYFPRIVMPLAEILTHSVQFTIQYALLLLLFGYHRLFLSTTMSVSIVSVAAVPAAFIGTLLLASGIGLICTSLTTTFRDVHYMVSYGIQMWFYATPIIYPTSNIPDYLRSIYLMNPMVSMIELFRYPFIGKLSVTAVQLSVHFILSVLLFIAGIMAFSHAEKSCVDKV